MVDELRRLTVEKAFNHKKVDDSTATRTRKVQPMRDTRGYSLHVLKRSG